MKPLCSHLSLDALVHFSLQESCPRGGLLHDHGNSVNLIGTELKQKVINPGNVLGPRKSEPLSQRSMIGKAPLGSNVPSASLTTLFRARATWTVVKSTAKHCYGRSQQHRGVLSMDWLDKAWNK